MQPNALPTPLRSNAPTHMAVEPLLADSYSSVAALPDDVLHLFERAERERTDLGAGWYHNLIRTVFPGHPGVRFYVLRQGGRPVAALPVRFDREGGHCLEALGNFYTWLYAPVLEPGLPPDVLAPLLREACREFGSVASLRFAPLDPASPAWATLQASLRACGFATFDFFCHGNWYQPVVDPWPAYLAQRKGQLRSTIKRAEKKLLADGAQIEILTRVDEVARAIDAFQQVYARSWKRPEPFPDFMPGLITLAAERGWMRVGAVWLGGQPVAAQFWIVAHGRAEIYKLAYDEAFKAQAPGTVLTARLMQHAMDVDRVTEIDYLIGDDAYKADWMSSRRERWGLVAFNLRSVRGCVGALREWAGRQLKQLRGTPPPQT